MGKVSNDASVVPLVWKLWMGIYFIIIQARVVHGSGSNRVPLTSIPPFRLKAPSHGRDPSQVLNQVLTTASQTTSCLATGSQLHLTCTHDAVNTSLDAFVGKHHTVRCIGFRGGRALPCATEFNL